jgi:hypothetical protein
MTLETVRKKQEYPAGCERARYRPGQTAPKIQSAAPWWCAHPDRQQKPEKQRQEKIRLRFKTQDGRTELRILFRGAGRDRWHETATKIEPKNTKKYKSNPEFVQCIESSMKFYHLLKSD